MKKTTINPLFRPDDCQLTKRLNLVSYNIQVGISASQINDYKSYIAQGWRHFLPHGDQRANLRQIAEVIQSYDIVALQEVDNGSLRTGFLNQAEFLANEASFPAWFSQVNRNLGTLAQHSNAVLSRFEPTVIEQHQLPGMIPGRGALVLKFGDLRQPLVLVILHLALGKRARLHQLNYLYELIKDYQHVVVMGDMNCQVEELLRSSLVIDSHLLPANLEENTYPSWQPSKNIDHILVSPTLKVLRSEVLSYQYSDHLPVAIELEVPAYLMHSQEDE